MVCINTAWLWKLSEVGINRVGITWRSPLCIESEERRDLAFSRGFCRAIRVCVGLVYVMGPHWDGKVVQMGTWGSHGGAAELWVHLSAVCTPVPPNVPSAGPAGPATVLCLQTMKPHLQKICLSSNCQRLHDAQDDTGFGSSGAEKLS